MFNLNLSFLSFSDGAKYAEIARNIVNGLGFGTRFHFWDNNIQNNLLGATFPADYIPAFMPYAIAFFFKIFGVNDMAVILTSSVFFLISLFFVFLLSNLIYKNKLISLATVAVVALNLDLINYSLSGASETAFIFLLLAVGYFISLKKKWANLLSFLLMIVLYLTRSQGVIYIFCFLTYFCFINFKPKRALLYSLIGVVVGSATYLLFSRQGLVAVTQNLPGNAVSDSLRGVEFKFDLLAVAKKVFYNLYNFYKAVPDILNPYLFLLFILGLVIKEKDQILTKFKLFTLLITSLTFLFTAMTIPFYRYIHPIVPFVYIISIGTLWKIVETFTSENINDNLKRLIFIGLVFVLGLGQTIGVVMLDSRFNKARFNVNKPPIYQQMAVKLKDSTDQNSVVVTNLDTWGSWYGERKTVWYPVDPEMIVPYKENINYIYLTSYKMDDENYYMGKKWREIFDNPENQKVLPEYKFVARYTFSSNDNFENEDGRAVLLIKKDADK